jgi:NhaP-type Na+/H+ or K+/H+ antiporter
MQDVLHLKIKSIIADIMPLIQLLTFIIAGLVVATFIGTNDFVSTQWYQIITASLLAIGLYASTYGIDLKEAKNHSKIILSAVTIGVVLKSLITGSILAFAFQDPLFFILGIVVAQIDPLSVAGLMKGQRMSKKAKTILASWASFDDPITVLLSLYAPVVILQLTGYNFYTSPSVTSLDNPLLSYFIELGLNIGLATLVFFIFWLVIRNSKHTNRSTNTGITFALYGLLVTTFSIAISYFMMLGIALVGLFLRPVEIGTYVDRIVTWALRIAAVILGALLLGGIDIWKGIALGIVAYVAQVIVGFILTRQLPKKDRWHIAFAQQNGITAIILALLFEASHPGIVAIVAPAIVSINILHWVCNHIIDRTVFKSSPTQNQMGS